MNKADLIEAILLYLEGEGSLDAFIEKEITLTEKKLLDIPSKLQELKEQPKEKINEQLTIILERLTAHLSA